MILICNRSVFNVPAWCEEEAYSATEMENHCVKNVRIQSFLVRIFLHLDWIWKDTEYLSLFNPNVRKYGPEKLRIRTLSRSEQFASIRKITVLFEVNNRGVHSSLFRSELYLSTANQSWKCYWKQVEYSSRQNLLS